MVAAERFRRGVLLLIHQGNINNIFGLYALVGVETTAIKRLFILEWKSVQIDYIKVGFGSLLQNANVLADTRDVNEALDLSFGNGKFRVWDLVKVFWEIFKAMFSTRLRDSPSSDVTDELLPSRLCDTSAKIKPKNNDILSKQTKTQSKDNVNRLWKKLLPLPFTFCQDRS
ncbi:MAG: hypothetical protein J3R72DRAFT_498967 [Linnemannia gamsii]|nr:MAG: hypothetical protein J3R72DRAFT_498967 [Linnemannia gamsii]